MSKYTYRNGRATAKPKQTKCEAKGCKWWAMPGFKTCLTHQDNELPKRDGPSSRSSQK